MPTVVHENVAHYAGGAITDGLREYTGLGVLDTPVQVLKNTEIETVSQRSGARGKRIPDLCIQVRLHPEDPEIYLSGVVWEVGFSQSLSSLKRRARMWLSGEAAGDRLELEVHLVVLIHVFEGEGPEVYYDEDGEVVMTRGKARQKMWDWPSRWFGGRGVGEEVERRGVADQSLREELTQEITDKLVQEDDKGNGKLMPLLLEKLGATLIAYERKHILDCGVLPAGAEPSNDDEKGRNRSGTGSRPDGGSGSSLQSAGDGHELSIFNNRPESSDSSANSDSEFYSDNTIDDNPNHNSTDGNTTDEADKTGDENVPDENVSPDNTPHDTTDDDPTDNDTTDNDTTDDDTIDDDTADATAGIRQVYTRPLLHNNLPIHDHPTPPFELRVAELYGPLPHNSTTLPQDILDIMPPMMRPHAHEKINFPLDKLVGSILRQHAQLRQRRAQARAEGIVKKAWEKVEAEMERVRREKARVSGVQERELRLAGRRRARSSRGEFGVDLGGAEREGGKKRARRER